MCPAIDKNDSMCPAINKNGDIYVCDYLNQRIQIL